MYIQANFVSIGFRFETKSPDIEKDILQSKKGSKISSLAKKRLFCIGTIKILRKHIFGLFLPHPPTL